MRRILRYTQQQGVLCAGTIVLLASNLARWQGSGGSMQPWPISGCLDSIDNITTCQQRSLTSTSEWLPLLLTVRLLSSLSSPPLSCPTTSFQVCTDILDESTTHCVHATCKHRQLDRIPVTTLGHCTPLRQDLSLHVKHQNILNATNLAEYGKCSYRTLVRLMTHRDASQHMTHQQPRCQ